MIPVQIDVIGTTALLVANPRTANPLDPLTKQIAEYTSKRKKTEADQLEIQRLKWLGSLYYDEEMGPYLPSENLWKSILDAARTTKEGKTIERGLLLANPKMRLEYDGPRKDQELYNDGRFIHVCDANASGRKIMAVRAMFPEWACQGQFIVNEEQLNIESLERIVQLAGAVIGVGTYRRRFGRYEADISVASEKRLSKAA